MNNRALIVCLLGLVTSLICTASAQVRTVALRDFEDGTVGGATSIAAANSAATLNSASTLGVAMESGSNRLRLMDDGSNTVNGFVITIPNALTGPGNWLVTADVKVAATDIRSFGMGARVGGISTAKIDDTNAGYVMNLPESYATASSLGYQTIGAAVQSTGANHLTLYFSTSPSGNSYNAPSSDGTHRYEHRTSTGASWTSSAGAVYIDNIRLIGPGSFGEDRHLWISIGDGFTNKASLESALLQAKQNNMNAVDYLARYRVNRTYLRSSLANPEPLYGGVGASFDPLQYVVDRGHELGLKVYVSFSLLVATDGHNSYPSRLPSGSETWVYNNGSPIPQTTAHSSTGIWMDIGRKDVRDYNLAIALDLVQNYDVDGIIFDRIRYEKSQFGYNPVALSEMGIVGTPSPTNANFRTKRREAVTEFLGSAYEQITDEKPWMVVGTVPIAYGSGLLDTYNGVFQFWPSWSSRPTRNRTVTFGAHDIIQPQFYRLWNSTTPHQAPAANQTLMRLAQWGHTQAYARDYGLFPGALVNLSPLFYHPRLDDPNQSAANSQNIYDSQQTGNFRMNGWGLYPALRSLAAMPEIKKPENNTGGVNVLASPAPTFDYLMKEGYDNTPPNNITTLTASNSSPGRITLSWQIPPPAADNEQPVKYLIYRSNTSPVRRYWENLVNQDFDVTETFFHDTRDTGLGDGNNHYLVVPVDAYNNKSVSNQAGPIAPAFMEVIVESRTPAGDLTLAPMYVENGGFTSTVSKSKALGLKGEGSRFNATVGTWARFQPAITAGGYYDVCTTVAGSLASNINANSAWTITNGTDSLSGELRLSPATPGLADQWYKLNEEPFYFPAGGSSAAGYVQFTNLDGNSSTGRRFVMDAVLFQAAPAPIGGSNLWQLQ